ncbi:hypothetical protein LIA77_01553 [Sarocladium implicatum]|nr:hypothetical protein LIA77_01553 [Sarocladium implicatum]
MSYSSQVSPFVNSIPSLPPERPDFKLETRIYTHRPLPPTPPTPPPKEIRRKPLGPDARLVGEAVRLPMARQKQDTAQDQEHPSLPAQGDGLSSPTFEDGFAFGVTLSPPPKSPFRRLYQPVTMTRTPTDAQRHRSSLKVQQLTGIDVDVFDDSPWKYGNFQMDTASDSDSVYSQDSINNATMKSWQTTTDEVPPLENDQDGHSSRVESWEPPTSPPLSGARGSLPSSAQPALSPKKTGSLTRRPRTKRKSRDQPMDNYHRIVTDIASPTTSRASVSDLPTAIHRPQQPTSNGLRNTQSCYGLASSLSISGMPPNFREMLTRPRQAPRPPLAQKGSGAERLGSFFDFDSDEDEDEDSAVSSSGRGRDSFLGMLLGRGSVEDERRSRSVSRGAAAAAARASSPPERLESDAIKTGKNAPASAGGSGATTGAAGKRAILKGWVDWSKKDRLASEEERRRREMKGKITVMGGRRL